MMKQTQIEFDNWIQINGDDGNAEWLWGTKRIGIGARYHDGYHFILCYDGQCKEIYSDKTWVDASQFAIESLCKMMIEDLIKN